ncbi:hypothetical protein V8C86DRAFT_2497069 [Haematococcus lacustris]
MKSAADELVRELLQTEAILERVARRLEEEFADRYQSAGVNPMSLVKRIQKLQAEVPDLRTDCEALIQRKQELVDAAKQQLVSNRTRLHQLASQSGLVLSECQDTVTGFQQAVAEWDTQQSQLVLHSTGANGQDQYSRDALNRALAGSMLA